MKRKWKRSVCEWCGVPKIHDSDPGKRGTQAFRCFNPDCDRPTAGRIPWSIPTLHLPYRRQCKTQSGETDPGFDDAVRAMEDG
jgi:hypothetical protein